MSSIKDECNKRDNHSHGRVENGTDTSANKTNEESSKSTLSTNHKSRLTSNGSYGHSCSKSPNEAERKKKTSPLSNSFSKEKRETLRRLLNASGNKNLKPPLFNRQKIDSYKLSLTFPTDNTSHSKSTSRSRSHSRSRSKSGSKSGSLLRSRSRSKSNDNRRSTSRTRDLSNSSNRSESRRSRNRSLSKPRTQSATKRSITKSPVKVSPPHFRKLTKQELGKNSLRGGLNNFERATLPTLIENTPKNSRHSSPSATTNKCNVIPNGRPLRFSGPLLPTPTR